MRDAISNLLQSLGTGNAFQQFVQNLRDVFKKTIADALATQVMNSIGAELNSLFTGLGTLLGFTAPTDLSAAITTASTVAATNMGSSITVAGLDAASNMYAAIVAASETASATNTVGQVAGGVATGGSTSKAAHGAAFVNGIRKFASGGVVSHATMFNYVGGVGQMGEAGTEGILPLSRDSSGNLGVHAQGLGGDAMELHIHNNIDARGASVETIMQVRQMLAENNVKIQGDLLKLLRRKRVPRV
jgi:phage-related minor tail protein